MNKLQEQPKQTPIEIALQIDEDGKTTAKKLYGFLELNAKNYSRWCEVNITKNEFADEGIDYMVFVAKEENLSGGRPTTDYKLSSAFAKKLAMTAKNEKGEQARDYFIKVEDKLKEAAINISGLSKEMQALITHDKKIQLVMDHMESTDKKVSDVDEDLQTFKKDIPLFALEIDRITKTKNRKVVPLLGGKLANAYKDKGLRTKVYKDLEKQLNREFGTTTFKQIKRSQCDIAIQIINEYKLPLALENEIENANLQINLEV